MALKIASSKELQEKYEKLKKQEENEIRETPKVKEARNSIYQVKRIPPSSCCELCGKETEGTFFHIQEGLLLCAECYATINGKSDTSVWDDLEIAVQKKTVLEGLVTEKNKGGLILNVKGMRVFVPASQSGQPRDADLSNMLKKKVSLHITEVDRDRKRIVGSISSVTQDTGTTIQTSSGEKTPQRSSGIELHLGDCVEMKKPHPCGGNQWLITHIGMDIKLECLRCGHEITMLRSKVEREIQQQERINSAPTVAEPKRYNAANAVQNLGDNFAFDDHAIYVIKNEAEKCILFNDCKKPIKSRCRSFLVALAEQGIISGVNYENKDGQITLSIPNSPFKAVENATDEKRLKHYTQKAYQRLVQDILEKCAYKPKNEIFQTYSAKKTNKKSDRSYFQTICDNCGEIAALPFEPLSDRPVYCSNCFSKRKELGLKRK